ncbi:MAG TPA: hypothetical protein VEA80_10760 [Vitreimonas sp.]|uniref:hypothetical protein n=1 Tax=Vitreimonas sp. TaxID=3069702 RepID=UPI002D302DEF|nr:hypothetical protein [Vitreimonas sp.]HYD87947.1 hypothetical protein [Vitreimonas sp.]
MRAAQPAIPYPCPRCEKRQINAKATTPFVRGLVIWFRLGEKTVIGCVGCVRTAIFGEAGLSLLIGWFSPFALIINPFMIGYGLLQGLFIGQNRSAARRHLHDQGFPTGVDGDLNRVCYALAVALIGGEWTKEAADLSGRELIFAKRENFSAERLDAVIAIGQRLLPGFEQADFEWYVATSMGLGHPLHVAQAARRVLAEEQCRVAADFLGQVGSSLEFPAQRQETIALIQRTLVGE